MTDPRDARIAELQAELAALRAAPEPEPEPAATEFLAGQELAEPEPGPPMYYGYSDPLEAMTGVTSTGHQVGDSAGLGAGVSN
jgi:hypothetical protein